MEISNTRKLEIQELAEFISAQYFPIGAIQPDVIASELDILSCYGNYGNSFDGVLEYYSGKFCIYINTDKIGSNKERERFSFAHELGHYFIDEHRNQLEKGNSLHGSSYNPHNKNIVEMEADYFAACLLMPSKRFDNIAKSRKFEFSIVDELKNEFQTSFTTILLRLIELNIYPLMFVYSKDNLVKYNWRTSDFPFKFIHNIKTTKKVPELTVAGDYFNRRIISDNTEIINADEWFSSFQDISRIKLFEKCIYQQSINAVISIIWQ